MTKAHCPVYSERLGQDVFQSSHLLDELSECDMVLGTPECPAWSNRTTDPMGFANTKTAALFIQVTTLLEKIIERFPAADRMLEITKVAWKKGADWKLQQEQLQQNFSVDEMIEIQAAEYGSPMLSVRSIVSTRFVVGFSMLRLPAGSGMGATKHQPICGARGGSV